MKRWLTLTIIALALIAGAVWVFKDKSNQPTTVQGQSSATDDHSEAGKYVYIKEWSVRFKLPDELQNQVIYAVEDQNTFFTSKQLAELPSSSCVVDASKKVYDGRVVLMRSTSEFENPSETDKRIANYWYRGVKTGGGGCTEASDGTAESTFISQMISAINSLETTGSNN